MCEQRYRAAFDLALEIVEGEVSEIPIVAPGTNAAWDQCARSIRDKLRLLYTATFGKRHNETGDGTHG